MELFYDWSRREGGKASTACKGFILSENDCKELRTTEGITILYYVECTASSNDADELLGFVCV